jgi:hypothetical protein
MICFIWRHFPNPNAWLFAHHHLNAINDFKKYADLWRQLILDGFRY